MKFLDWIKDKIWETKEVVLTGENPLIITDTMHDDLPLNMGGAVAVGVNTPVMKVFRNDGQASPSYAGEYDGSTSYSTVPYYSDMDTQSLTINLWIKAYKDNSVEIMDRDGGGFEYYVGSNGEIIFKINGQRVSTASGMVTVGATQHIAVTVNEEGANSRVKIYINNDLKYETVKNVLLKNTTEGYIFGKYQSGGWYYNGIIDEIQVYNVALTQSQVSELYNNGEGSITVPTGIDEATQMIAHFSDSNTNEATLGSGYDMTLNNVDFVEGLIGITNGSFGVLAEAWEPNKHTAKFGSMQMRHKKKLGTPINPHYHFSLSEAPQIGDKIYMEIEYIWANPNDAIGNTTVEGFVIDLTTNGFTEAFKHYIKDFSDIDLSSENGVSAMAWIRLSRRGDKEEDTYQGDVFLHQFDFHYEIDSLGSKDRWVK